MSPRGFDETRFHGDGLRDASDYYSNRRDLHLLTRQGTSVEPWSLCERETLVLLQVSFRNRGSIRTPAEDILEEGVSGRMNVLDKHYDKRSEQVKMEQRREFLSDR